MMSRARSGALLVLLLCVAPEADCTEGESVPAAGSGFEARLRLEREDGRQADTLAAGETLVLVLTLRNPADSPLRLPLSTAQTHDFSITTDDGRELWRWSAGRRFAQVLTELELAPGEERSFRGAWSQRSADGSPAPPGRYRAGAWIGARGTVILVETVEFRIH